MFGVAVDLATSWGHPGVVGTNLLAFVEDEGEFAMVLAMFALCVAIYDVETLRHRALSAGADTRSGLMQA